MSDSELDEQLIARPQLRVELLTPEVQVTPGDTVTLALLVRNTSSVIEELEIRMVGVVPESVVQTPEQLTLFPEEDVRVTLDVTFHRSLPSGTHEGAIVVSGRSGTAIAAELAFTVRVPEQPKLELRAEPPVRTAGRRAAFEVIADNTGNTELGLLLRAHDADRVLDLALSQRKVNLRVDQTAYATLVAYRKRPWTGAPVEHTITVVAEDDELEQTTELRFRQKAILTPGVITVLVLALIVLLWAAAMLFGVRAAMSAPEPTKAVPETFLQGSGRGDLDPATSGGQIGGAVTAVSTGQPVPRVTVEAFDAAGELVTATASDDDGSYELAGLVPGRYRLRIRATGFEERWWPGVTQSADAGELVVAAREITEDTDLRLAGEPASLGGQAVAGDGDPAEINVEVTPLDLTVDEPPTVTTTDVDGVWSVTGLTAPATYRITYSAGGYATVELTEEVPAGEELVLSSTRLPAAPGSIAGIVQDRDGNPLGGVEVSAQSGDVGASTTTPTSGEVGAFSLPDLETPGTYLLTFAAEGYTSETQGVRLGPGESISDLTVTLSTATGVVRGQATSADGRPLGGVSVTISGGDTVQETETLTSGQVGSFSQSGLPLPGVYTLTFDAEGYGRESVRVELTGDSPEGSASVVMTATSARITGVVVDEGSGDPIAGAEVEISDGATVRETTTASSPAQQQGRFNVGGLVPGSYTITARSPGGGTVTILETVRGSETLDVTLEVPGS